MLVIQVDYNVIIAIIIILVMILLGMIVRYFTMTTAMSTIWKNKINTCAYNNYISIMYHVMVHYIAIQQLKNIVTIH